jgi:prephenate dehydratase
MVTTLQREIAQSHQVTDSALSRLPTGSDLTIATLGPPGTSSEQASHFLAGHLLRRGHASARIELFRRYEDAGEALACGKAELILVANAFSDINVFYMDPGLRLAAVFIKDTPRYGLAAPPGSSAPGPVRVATHPAPKFLVAELLPEGYELRDLCLVDSTSTAAASVRDGDVDLALTTAVAARLHGLDFVSPTRPIRMVWSAFTRAELVGERAVPMPVFTS